ncbi:MAG: DUF2344 domain-containing protein [Clostridiales bacterium]|jgi:radical SAM-linked protein|nr:DUF2344 domain-containing protein [Clostridiales bacterium]
MRLIRLRFTKVNRAKYISHLDLNRTFSRALRRANIPLWYTEGFNPHPYINFALPLPLGVESVNDAMDIKIEGDIPCDEIQARLNEVLPDDIKITACDEAVMQVKDIKNARYSLLFDGERVSLPELEKRLGGELKAMKKVKSGHKRVIKEVDITEYVKDYTLTQTEGDILLTITLPAGSSFNISPMLLLDAIFATENTEDNSNMRYVKNIRRKRLLTEDFEEFR